MPNFFSVANPKRYLSHGNSKVAAVCIGIICLQRSSRIGCCEQSCWHVASEDSASLEAALGMHDLFPYSYPPSGALRLATTTNLRQPSLVNLQDLFSSESNNKSHRCPMCYYSNDLFRSRGRRSRVSFRELPQIHIESRVASLRVERLAQRC